MTVAGVYAEEDQFYPGTGSSAYFWGPVAEIYAHPLVPDFFFVAEDNGIRLFCMYINARHTTA